MESQHRTELNGGKWSVAYAPLGVTEPLKLIIVFFKPWWKLDTL